MIMLWQDTIKPTLKLFGVHKVVHKLKFIYKRTKLSGQNPENIFTSIYQNNEWKGQESVSGQGSDLLETKALLAKLPALFAKYDVKTIIDLPCGDYNWMQHLDYSFNYYQGIDIVQKIVENNNKKYGNDTTVFHQKNCLQDEIGDADLLICRDLLIHFSNEDVFKFFDNLKKSNITYLLTTHFIDEKNIDIATGQWRAINLTAPPFSLPEPLDYITEETKMYDGKYAETKTMSLWRLKDIL